MITNETKKEIGKFLIDVAKLVLGGIVFASIVKSENLPKTYVIVLGLSTIILFVIGGFALINKSTKPV